MDFRLHLTEGYTDYDIPPDALEDAEFAANPQAILMYFYDIVRKRAHQNNELHPAWRIMK